MFVLHWAMAILILAAWATGEGGRHVRENPPLLHFWLGLSVLVLLVPRLLARFVGGVPPLDVSQRPWVALAAKAGHAVFYLFMIALPLSGWYAASRLGVAVSFFGIPLPPLAAAVQGSPGLIADLHETGGSLILWLAGLHALVAVWHHFVWRDGTLSRMSPV
jgi:cytochrome b561